MTRDDTMCIINSTSARDRFSECARIPWQEGYHLGHSYRTDTSRTLNASRGYLCIPNGPSELVLCVNDGWLCYFVWGNLKLLGMDFMGFRLRFVTCNDTNGTKVATFSWHVTILGWHRTRYLRCTQRYEWTPGRGYPLLLSHAKDTNG
jgi:hypothetical protein